MSVGVTVRGVLVILPALLQSTVKVFFCPMKALERPDPRDATLLASEENLGKEAKDPAMVDDLVTVSTRTDEVSWRLCPPDRRGPGHGDRETIFTKIDPNPKHYMGLCRGNII